MHIFRMSCKVLIVSIVTLLCFVSCKNIFEKSASDYPLEEISITEAIVRENFEPNMIVLFENINLPSHGYYWDVNGKNECDFRDIVSIENEVSSNPVYTLDDFFYNQSFFDMVPIPTTVYFNTNKEFFYVSNDGEGVISIRRFRISTPSIPITYQ
jgi:hypothetical protein